MNRRNYWQNLSILAICVAASFFIDCARPVKKDEKEEHETPVAKHGDRIGAEDFMPDRIRNIYARSCASCHGPDGHGVTAVAPDIYSAKFRPMEEWVKYLHDSTGPHPANQPPPLWLNEEEIKIMAEYLEMATKTNQ